MPIIPLEKRLRKKAHKDVAVAQDMLVETIYTFFPKSVIHGGTAIWRCYNSKRFSEDIDVYMPRGLGKEKESDLELSFQSFLDSLKSKGFVVKKFKRTNGSIFSKFEISDVEVRFEAIFKNVKNFIVKPFEASDGTFMNVYTLSPEDLLIEKVAAYKTRKKVRDLYDIWFLLNLVSDVDKVRKIVEDFARDIDIEKGVDAGWKSADYKTLKALIVLGPVPTVENLIEGIKSWVKRNT